MVYTISVNLNGRKIFETAESKKLGSVDKNNIRHSFNTKLSIRPPNQPWSESTLDLNLWSWWLPPVEDTTTLQLKKKLVKTTNYMTEVGDPLDIYSPDQYTICITHSQYTQLTHSKYTLSMHPINTPY